MSADHSALFAGRYLLEEVLGSGGTGSVRRGRDTVLDRPVAVKLLRSGAANDVNTARLRSEAQLAGSLHHPGIAQVFDYGQAVLPGSSDEPTPYIVMQLIEGPSLAAVLRDRQTLPVDDVMALVAQVAEALAVAHEAGIVHRDLKPGNIVMSPTGLPVLVDFGIARGVGGDPLTMTGTIVGTVDYLSPEQAGGGSATPSSDLYALGMVAYEALTGTRPMRRESHVATALAQIQDDVPPLGDDVAPEVAALVMQLVEKDPAARPASAAEVSARAATLAGVLGGDRWARVTAGSGTPAVGPATGATTRVVPAAGARGRGIYVGVAVLVAVLAAAFFVAARPAVVKVPDVRGMSLKAAKAELRALDIAEIEPDYVDDPRSARGTVLWQDPAPGGRLADGSSVVLEVASGRIRMAADSVMGLDYESAAQAVVKLGLVPSRREVDRDGDLGAVVAVSPSGRLPLGSTVLLSVAVAPEPSAAPARTSGASKPSAGTGSKATRGGKAKGKAKRGKSKPAKSNGKRK
ncbi:protein kinase [Nocardioides sp.]|uniref:protein kinase domain-containing protein n=1 Tax=Nocardioides sp. TaxID=35761 RepID=UPI00356699A4